MWDCTRLRVCISVDKPCHERAASKDKTNKASMTSTKVKPCEWFKHFEGPERLEGIEDL